MNNIDWIGFIGVFLILIAYFLNVLQKLQNNSLPFILLNLFGASLACLASVLLNYLPFIILEGIWAFISFISLLKYKKERL
ncbi:hypothetical protein [uncultured Polaribacter sp.]|uniref:CBU_0592 family membrane protein n=1 Tax=uncultured Polaribacter sp. TaxID=174711 RepID=UPI00275B8549|nr:hypothetical protein [Polaribacter sp.]|tara:strand:+ start:1357 stop:1599 length:243 start_codon:yes stop_codon:yes gene_type:complete